MDQSAGLASSFEEAPAVFATGPSRLFSVFFLDPDMASTRLAELTEFAITKRAAGWTEKAAITRALALVIPRAHECVAAQCAQALALNHFVDPIVANAFLARRDQSSRIILSESSAISQRLSMQIAALGSDDEARALTARTDLDETVLHVLLNRRDRPVDILLAENHGLTLSRLMIERMMTRALLDPALCHSLFDRPDLETKDRAGLFIHAAMSQRERVVMEVATLFDAYEGEAIPDRDTLLTELGTAMTAHDFAGFMSTLARHLDTDTARLAVAMMESTGAVLVLIAVVIGAPDAFVDKMQRVWSRPSPHEPRKRHALDTLRRSMTPAMAGYILDSILAIDITDDRKRGIRSYEGEVELDFNVARKSLRERIG